MKIATWNINSVNSRLDLLLTWCHTAQPDVLRLPETKCVDAKFPAERLRAVGFEHSAFFGEKSYNGVAIVSKYEIGDVRKNFPDNMADSQRRQIAGTINGIYIVNTYVPQGTGFGTDKFTYKLDWINRLRKYFDANLDLDEKVLLCRDLNVAPHELDVWKVSFWKDKLRFTKPERDAIQTLKKWGFVAVFGQLNDEAGEYSWWDYFHHSFEKNRGPRIDHIWASPPLAELCTDCWIDKGPRALERPSDQAPVIAEFNI